jgi:cytochrome c556
VDIDRFLYLAAFSEKVIRKKPQLRMKIDMVSDVKKILFVVLIAISSIVSLAHADDEITSSVEPLALRKIMRDMGDDMQVITDAISREDWALIVKTAPKIADHPQPPFTEKIRILAFAGTNVSKFKKFDGKTHAAASRLGKVAEEEDAYAVIDEFATLQKTCMACHQRFRKSFQDYFYQAD